MTATTDGTEVLDAYVDIIRQRIGELVDVVDEKEADRLLALYFLGARDAYQLAQDLSVEERAEAHNQYAAMFRRMTRR